MEQIKYTAAVNDDLVKTYNFIIKHGLQFSKPHVSLASYQTSGFHSSEAWVDKFLNELTYIEYIAKIQPELTIISKHWIYLENNERVLSEAEEKTSVKTFSANKMNQEIISFKRNNHLIKEINRTEIKNLEFLEGVFRE